MTRRINARQLAVYKRYRGDEDGLARAGTASEKALMADVKWSSITDAIQRASIVRRGLADEAFERELNEFVRENFEDGIGIADLVLADP